MNNLAHYNHARVSEVTADAVQDNLYDFRVRDLGNNDVLPMTELIGMTADFENIPELGEVTEATFEEYLHSFLNNEINEGFVSKLDGMSKERVREVLAFRYVMLQSVKAFGVPEVDQSVRDASFENYRIDPERRDSLQIKPLSATPKGEAFCTEYALFAKEGLAKLGVEVDYVTGHRQLWPDQDSVFHSFLVDQSGTLVLDPLDAAKSINTNLPFGVMISDTSYNDSDVRAKSIVNGNSMSYAHNPIVAQRVASVA